LRAFRSHLTGHDIDLGRFGLVLTLAEKQMVVKYSTELEEIPLYAVRLALPVQNQNLLPFSIKTHNATEKSLWALCSARVSGESR
jgi:hypothetical protein